MRTFTSYVSDYQAHRGSRSINALTRAEQDKLVHLLFEPEGDLHGFVIENNIDHAEPDGLWAIVVALGLFLERKSIIKEFPTASTNDRDRIINMLAGTRLWLRLEEAFEPFNEAFERTDYDWTELRPFGRQIETSDLEGDNVAARLKLRLAPAPVDPEGLERRLAFQDFVEKWETGRLEFFVNRVDAVQAYRLSSSVWTTILPTTFLLGLVAFIPVMVLISFWWGLGVLALAIAARKFLTKQADAWVRKEALSDRERYRWFTARRIIWAKLPRAGR